MEGERMASRTSKTEWLDRIDRERAAWDAIVAEAERAGMERPGCAGEWTFKDVVGHLIGWRVRTISRLEAAARGESPPPPQWPADADPDTEEGLQAINSWMYVHYRDQR
jgi:Mycothiol maleylpyruvate isomerase N-terminal domain